MAEQKFSETVGSLFDGMEKYMSTKTVVGEAVHVGDAVLLPLVDVSFGMGAGTSSKEKGGSIAGGMGGKMSPTAVLVIRGDSVRMIPVSSSDPVSKIIDMAPDLINRILHGADEDEEIIEETAKEMTQDKPEA